MTATDLTFKSTKFTIPWLCLEGMERAQDRELSLDPISSSTSLSPTVQTESNCFFLHYPLNKIVSSGFKLWRFVQYSFKKLWFHLVINFGGQQLVLLLEINRQIFHLHNVRKSQTDGGLGPNAGHFCRNILGHSEWWLVQKNKRSKYQEQRSSGILLVDLKPEEAEVLRCCLVWSVFHHLFYRRAGEESQGVRGCGKATLWLQSRSTVALLWTSSDKCFVNEVVAFSIRVPPSDQLSQTLAMVAWHDRKGRNLQCCSHDTHSWAELNQLPLESLAVWASARSDQWSYA